jgi:hypothetical protein
LVEFDRLEKKVLRKNPEGARIGTMEPTTQASANLRFIVKARQTGQSIELSRSAFIHRLRAYSVETLRAMLSRRQGRPQGSQYVLDVQAELVRRARPACIVDDDTLLPF